MIWAVYTTFLVMDRMQLLWDVLQFIMHICPNNYCDSIKSIVLTGAFDSILQHTWSHTCVRTCTHVHIVVCMSIFNSLLGVMRLISDTKMSAIAADGVMPYVTMVSAAKADWIVHTRTLKYITHCVKLELSLTNIEKTAFVCCVVYVVRSHTSINKISACLSAFLFVCLSVCLSVSLMIIYIFA